jgi:tRNA G10  N-methylase Trm11
VIPTKKVDHLLIYEQLFKAAGKMLKPGGMLVYLYPFDREHGPATLKDIPQHESFELVNYAEEWLTM